MLTDFEEARLVMVGEGELLPLCKRLARGMGIENNVEFKGVQTSEEIRNLFENSLAFMQHSIVADSGDSEGTPVAILEAQAASLPVIATRHAGIPDVVINNKTGLLVEELDVEGMALQHEKIVDRKRPCEKIGNRSKRQGITTFYYGKVS